MQDLHILSGMEKSDLESVSSLVSQMIDKLDEFSDLPTEKISKDKLISATDKVMDLLWSCRNLLDSVLG